MEETTIVVAHKSNELHVSFPTIEVLATIFYDFSEELVESEQTSDIPLVMKMRIVFCPHPREVETVPNQPQL